MELKEQWGGSIRSERNNERTKRNERNNGTKEQWKGQRK
jgi:hypothetical protein